MPDGLPWLWNAAVMLVLVSSIMIIDAENLSGTRRVSEVLARHLTEIDAEYFAPGRPVDPAQRQMCSAFAQTESLKGQWVSHPSPGYQGISNPDKCPSFIADWDCRGAYVDSQYKALQAQEFSKVFKPHACELNPWNASHFEQCLKGRRVIIIGDSTMRQTFQSLACLMTDQIKDGFFLDWTDVNSSHTSIPFKRKYMIRDEEGVDILKQNVGKFTLKNGAEVHIASFGIFNLTLWDDVMAQFAPLTSDDVILVDWCPQIYLFNGLKPWTRILANMRDLFEPHLETYGAKMLWRAYGATFISSALSAHAGAEFGAWYPRFNTFNGVKPWMRFLADMRDLFELRLKTYNAQVLWRAYGATHFGGPTGTYTAMNDHLSDMPAQATCEPASHGEYYYDTEILKYLQNDCGAACSHIHMLPVYHLSLLAHNSHHGSFGRGISERHIDCRHFCANVIDTWNQVLYNKLCFA